MSGSKQVWYRLCARPDKDKTYKIVIQRRRWLFFWADWYPVDNYVRTLQQEFIDHFDRMQEVIEELKDAEAYVAEAYNELARGNLHKGHGVPFKDQLSARETLKPDVSSRFKTVKELVTQESQGRKRPTGGTRTLMIGATGRRFDVSSLNREAIGEEFNADHVMTYRSPQHDHGKSKQKGNQNQNQHQNKQE